MDLTKLVATHRAAAAAGAAPHRDDGGAGRPATAPRRLDLRLLVHEAARHRARELAAHARELRLRLGAAAVRSEPRLLAALLQRLLDWGHEQACGRVELTLDHTPWPERAQLCCSFARLPADAWPTTTHDGHLTDEPDDTRTWRAVENLAAMLGLVLRRHDGDGRSVAVIEFPCTLAPGLAAAAAADDGPGDTVPAELCPQPLVGHQVLLLAARRELRGQAAAALRPLRPMLDFVTSVDAARDYCATGLPHSLVYEEGLADAAFERLRYQLGRQSPRLVFVRIVDAGRWLDIAHAGGRTLVSVGRDALIDALPAALRFEITRLS